MTLMRQKYFVRMSVTTKGYRIFRKLRIMKAMLPTDPHAFQAPRPQDHDPMVIYDVVVWMEEQQQP